MDNDIDNEMKGFEEQIANNMRYNLEEEDVPRYKAFLDFSSQRKTLILGGIGVLLLIILIALFFGGGDTLSKKDLASFKARLNLLEKRLTRFEGVELRVTSLEKKEKELEQSIAEADNAKRLINQQYNKLAQRLEKPQKEKTIIPSKTKAPIANQKTPSSLSEERFHEVRTGDNLYRIAQKYRISLDELCRLNNITSKQAIYPGQKLLVTPESTQ